MRTAVLTAALIGLAPCSALADKLGEHPSVVVKRLQASQSYDYAAKFYPHPAGLYAAAEAPRTFAGIPAIDKFVGAAGDDTLMVPAGGAITCSGAACVDSGRGAAGRTYPQGVVIDQTAALAGNVSPGDAPGFPITLSRGGHYTLDSDLVVPADTPGIVIAAPNVTLDLGGHTLRGPVNCSRGQAMLSVACDAASKFSAIVGISSVGAAGAVIRNGVVQGFAGLGVHYGEGTLLDDLQVRSNAGVGIAGAGYATQGIVRGVLVQNNGGPGIVCENMRVERSTFAANGGTGVDCRDSWFVNTVTRDNGGYGVAEGSKHGLHSFGNRLGDEPGAAGRRYEPE
jgi:Right handed beta helix region